MENTCADLHVLNTCVVVAVCSPVEQRPSGVAPSVTNTRDVTLAVVLNGLNVFVKIDMELRTCNILAGLTALDAALP